MKSITPLDLVRIILLGLGVFAVFIFVSYVEKNPIIFVPLIIYNFSVFVLTDVYKKRKESEKLQRLSDLESIFSEYQANPLEFESFVANIFSLNGFNRVKVTSPTSDGGKDIIMYKNGHKCIVEVKLYKRTNKIGRGQIQKLHSAKIDEKADYAIFLTTSDFTNPAKEYAEKHSIELINGTDFLQLIPTRK